MGKKDRPGIPKSKVQASNNSVEAIAQQIIYIMTLNMRARSYLRSNKRLTPRLDFQLVTETNFAAGILINIFSLEKSYIKNIQAQMQADKDRFEKELEKFCESIVPDASKPKIFTVQEFEKELAQKRGLKQRKPGSFIMP